MQCKVNKDCDELVRLSRGHGRQYDTWSLHNHLLGVSGPLHFCKVRVRIYSSQKDGLELIHAGIGKKQCGICMRHYTAAGDYCMAFALEKFHEC